MHLRAITERVPLCPEWVRSGSPSGTMVQYPFGAQAPWAFSRIQIVKRICIND